MDAQGVGGGRSRVSLIECCGTLWCRGGFVPLLIYSHSLEVPFAAYALLQWFLVLPISIGSNVDVAILFVHATALRRSPRQLCCAALCAHLQPAPDACLPHSGVLLPFLARLL